MELLAIKKRKDSILELYHSVQLESKETLPAKHKGANDFQRLYRGSKARSYIAFKSHKANTIQRVVRGIFARVKALRLRISKINHRRSLTMTYFVLQLQRVFRGYYSRKYRANHKNRKAFIQHITTTAEAIRTKLNLYSIEQLKYEEQEYYDKKNNDFRSYAENLHHLVSTKHIRGVFNPNPEYMETPLVDDIPVEDHVRYAVKDLLRTKGIQKTGLVTDLNGTRIIPLKTLKSKLSVQASAPYDTIKNEKTRTKLVHKLLTKGKGDWFAGGKTQLLVDQNYVPLSTGDPFFDQYSNPMLIRGVPESQQVLHQTCLTRKPLFIKQLDKPFYSRTGGNKSNVLANDLFDAIADAEESGGTVSRHKGKSTRFGISDNCDNRPLDTLPLPPSRPSLFRPSRPILKSKTLLRKPNSGTYGGNSTDVSKSINNLNVDSSDDET